jgi:hypothetical protein
MTVESRLTPQSSVRASARASRRTSSFGLGQARGQARQGGRRQILEVTAWLVDARPDFAHRLGQGRVERESVKPVAQRRNHFHRLDAPFGSVGQADLADGLEQVSYPSDLIGVVRWVCGQ